ncbi:hypothetical protein B0J13DRAFT_558311 [Dactylonectria estremocensis]|uniref:Peptidase metallopeptidase domain-containing protein n=1 Tax=Dactylonectria estremocensis TaxID=1079267 RepID=A0A9P9EMD9_9HYPO|nr:hypothetical protein B0J13DRAFT_558311 [Dactylonectria estremocensis]
MASGPSTKEILLDAVAQTLGKDALEPVEPTEIHSPDHGKTVVEEAPACITQRAIPVNLRNGPADIIVGLNNEVPRWVPGSVIKWAAWRQGFNSQDDADYAASQLAIAAEEWNKADIGVTFEWVPLAKDATFVICHGGAMGGVLASAFFPNANDLNYLYVYTSAFRPPYKQGMWKIFAHELGHVLGLRHEFAIEGNPDMGLNAEGRGAVVLGARNENSVMNYRRELPEIQPSDIQDTKYFYALSDDAQGNPPKVGLTPVSDYTPR